MGQERQDEFDWLEGLGPASLGRPLGPPQRRGLGPEVKRGALGEVAARLAEKLPAAEYRRWAFPLVG